MKKKRSSMGNIQGRAPAWVRGLTGGRELSYDDIRHYQRIVVALGETGRLMNSGCLVEMFED